GCRHPPFVLDEVGAVIAQVGRGDRRCRERFVVSALKPAAEAEQVGTIVDDGLGRGLLALEFLDKQRQFRTGVRQRFLECWCCCSNHCCLHYTERFPGVTAAIAAGSQTWVVAILSVKYLLVPYII